MNYNVTEIDLTQLSKEQLQEMAIAAAEGVINVIKDFEGLEIELKGYWVWVSGNTKQHKDVLKSLGFHSCVKDGVFYWAWKPNFMPKTRTRRAFTKRKLDDTYGTQLHVTGSSRRPEDNV